MQKPHEQILCGTSLLGLLPVTAPPAHPRGLFQAAFPAAVGFFYAEATRYNVDMRYYN